jgi:hypothetical protein
MFVDATFAGWVAGVPGRPTDMGRHAMGHRRTSMIALVSAVAALALVTASPASGSVAQADGPGVEEFTGTVDEFYVVPDPLPPGEPGDLIRVQEVAATDSEVTVRVMYHSRDARDRDRAVTGIVTYPTAPAPDGGWPVVSWAHGGVSLASQCAPSRAGLAAPAFGVSGVRVASDYIGLGPVGELSPVLSRPSVGNSVIDAVRAARQLPAAHAGTRWVSIGHSAGGHGALAAHELADSRAPELDHLATVALAPASGFDRTFGPVDEIVTSVVGAAMLYGAPSEHPEIVPEDYAGPGLTALGETIRTGCQPDFEAPVAAARAAEGDAFWRNDPLVTEPARSLLLANDVGNVAADAPVLLASGDADPIVVIDRVRYLYERQCAAGQVVELVEVAGADHGTVLPMTADLVEPWVADRLAGAPASGTCGEGPNPPDPGGPGAPGSPGAPGAPGEPAGPRPAPPATPIVRAPNYTG